MIVIECSYCKKTKKVSETEIWRPASFGWGTVWRPARGGILWVCNKCKDLVPYADSEETEQSMITIKQEHSGLTVSCDTCLEIGTECKAITIKHEEDKLI